MGNYFTSFYDYMMKYPHQNPGRIALAEELRQLAPHHRKVKEIDSLVDLMMVASLLKNEKAIEAASGSLWYEYCAVSGRSTD